MVIDTQVHLNREIGIEASLFAMDAVGIDAVLIDEWSGYDGNGIGRPYRFLPNGAVRSEYPMAREAVRLFPNRFAYTAHLDRNDPDLLDLIAEIAANPHQLCVRLSPKESAGTLQALTAGEFDRMFGALEENAIPVMINLPGNLSLAGRMATMFPDLRIVLDHCGMFPLRPGMTVNRDFFFSDVAECVNHSNIHVKVSFAPTLSKEEFPFSDLVPHVRRLIEIYGPERLMWASDHTQTKVHHTWAEALLYLQVPGVVSDTEKEWIFGRTAREVLSWPITESFGRPARRQYHQALI